MTWDCFLRSKLTQWPHCEEMCPPDCYEEKYELLYSQYRRFAHVSQQVSSTNPDWGQDTRVRILIKYRSFQERHLEDVAHFDFIELMSYLAGLIGLWFGWGIFDVPYLVMERYEKWKRERKRRERMKRRLKMRGIGGEAGRKWTTLKTSVAMMGLNNRSRTRTAWNYDPSTAWDGRRKAFAKLMSKMNCAGQDNCEVIELERTTYRY